MIDYMLPKTREIAHMAVLTPGDIGAVVALHEAVSRDLAHPSHLMPQATGYFEKLLAGDGGIMVGIRAATPGQTSGGGRLVAQMAIVGPIELGKAQEHQLITHVKAPFHHANPDDAVIVMKSKCVHPDRRGNRLSSHLLGFALEQERSKAATHAFATISAANRPSWKVFAQEGDFKIVAAGIDPRDHQPRLVLQKWDGFHFPQPSAHDMIDPAVDFDAARRLTVERGLVGCVIPDSSAFTFRRPDHKQSRTSMRYIA